MKVKIFLFSMFLVMSSMLAAAPANPTTMLQTTADDIIVTLQQDQADLTVHPEAVYKIVQQKLLPIVDVAGMSRSVIAADVWRQASNDQRRQFAQEFVKMLVLTYSSSISDYNGETIEFRSVRGGYENKRFVKVNGVIVRPGATDVPVIYDLVLKGDEWKIYDLSVEGIGFLQTFRSQFASELSNMTFMELISKLSQQNAALA